MPYHRSSKCRRKAKRKTRKLTPDKEVTFPIKKHCIAVMQVKKIFSPGQQRRLSNEEKRGAINAEISTIRNNVAEMINRRGFIAISPQSVLDLFVEWANDVDQLENIDDDRLQSICASILREGWNVTSAEVITPQ